MARGYGGVAQGGIRVCGRYNNNTTPEIVGRGGYFTYRLPNTEHCIAYTEYRIQNTGLSVRHIVLRIPYTEYRCGT